MINMSLRAVFSLLMRALRRFPFKFQFRSVLLLYIPPKSSSALSCLNSQALRLDLAGSIIPSSLVTPTVPVLGLPPPCCCLALRPRGRSGTFQLRLRLLLPSSLPCVSSLSTVVLRALVSAPRRPVFHHAVFYSQLVTLRYPQFVLPRRI
jgi:hypothetical protein